MPKHSKNTTSKPVFTSHERKAAGFGTKRKRLGRDSLRDFDSCCLSMGVVEDPVITKEGYLYSKLALVQYMCDQKKAGQMAKKKAQEDRARVQRIQREREAQRQEAKLERFVRQEGGIGFRDCGTESDDKDKGMAPVPAYSEDLAMPTSAVLCPMSRQPLRLKSLTPVVFTKAHPEDTYEALIHRDLADRYVCAGCRSSLTNASNCEVVESSGLVLCGGCAQPIRQSRPDSPGYDPVTGESLQQPLALIRFAPCGTGFASAQGSETIELSIHTPGF